MPVQSKDRPVATAGVWESDAPEGYVALIVTSSKGKMVLRIEIAEEWFSKAWVTWLERWLRRWDRYGLQVVK